MNTPASSTEAQDANRTILRVQAVMCAVVIILGLLLFYSVSRETDAVSALRKNSDRTECRSNISTDTYQRYWVDVARALDGAANRNNAEVIAATKDMNSIPLIKQQVAAACPPALGSAVRGAQ